MCAFYSQCSYHSTHVEVKKELVRVSYLYTCMFWESSTDFCLVNSPLLATPSHGLLFYLHAIFIRKREGSLF